MKATIISLLVLLGSVAIADVVATDLIAFEIEDQFQEKHGDAEFRGRVSVFVWADRKGSEHMDLWADALRGSLTAELESGSLTLRKIAHVKGAPFFVKGRIRKRFGEDRERWALLDWEGRFRKAYEPAESQIALFVFGSDGQLAYRGSFPELDQPQIDEAVSAARGLLGSGSRSD